MFSFKFVITGTLTLTAEIIKTTRKRRNEYNVNSFLFLKGTVNILMKTFVKIEHFGLIVIFLVLFLLLTSQ